MKRKILSFISLLLAAALLSACGADGGGDTPAPRLSASSLDIKLGESENLSVENYEGDVIWSSSDEKIASVSSGGLVSAVAIGNAAVSAKIDGGETMSCVVTVSAGVSNVTAISVTSYYSSSSDITINFADSPSVLLKATLTGAEPGEAIIWKSENESIATVDQNGTVTALANGVTKISASAMNAVKGECVIRVKNAPENAPATEGGETRPESARESGAADETLPREEETETEIKLPVSLPTAQSNIVISDTEIYMSVAEDRQLSVTLSNAPAGTYVDWRTTNKAVAVVKYGKVVAVGDGVCAVSAITSDGAAASCYVAVGKTGRKQLKEMLKK